MLTSAIWDKLYKEFNDPSRWEFDEEPEYIQDSETEEYSYTGYRIFTITWKPSSVCFDYLYLKYLNTSIPESPSWGHVLKVITRNYTTANQYQEDTVSWKCKDRYGYIWDQQCSFNDTDKTLTVEAYVSDKLLSYSKLHREKPDVLTSQRLKVVLAVPICHNDPEFPLIKHSTPSWQARSAAREVGIPKVASGGGPIKFSTHLWCKVAKERDSGTPIIYDFKSAYDYNYGRTYIDSDTGAEGVNCHHRYYTKWVTKDYRIGHNRARWNKKIKK